MAYTATLEKAGAKAGDDAAEAAWFEVVNGTVLLPDGGRWLSTMLRAPRTQRG